MLISVIFRNLINFDLKIYWEGRILDKCDFFLNLHKYTWPYQNSPLRSTFVVLIILGNFDFRLNNLEKI